MRKSEIEVGQKVQTEGGKCYDVMWIANEPAWDDEEVLGKGIDQDNDTYYILLDPSRLRPVPVKTEFEEGQYIRGISDRYVHTDEDMYIGKIVDMRTGKATHNENEKVDIMIKVLDHEREEQIGKTHWAFGASGNFKIIDIKKEA